jgi:hypothetical protein
LRNEGGNIVDAEIPGMNQMRNLPSGVQIFKHAFQMVTQNIVQAAQITGPWYLAVVMLAFVLPSMFGIDSILMQDLSQGAQVEGNVLLYLLVSSLFILVLFSVIAVVWHRYVLLDSDDKRAASPSAGEPVVKYTQRALMVGVAVFVVLVLLSLLTLGLGSGGAVLGQLLSLFIATYVAMRISLGLPAASIGRSIGLFESWEKTKPLSNELWIVVAIQVALFALLSFIPFIGILVTWFMIVIGASILTTIYGVLIEGRTLARG